MSMAMDNYHFDVTAYGPDAFVLALSLALLDWSKAEAWEQKVIDGRQTLVLYWHRSGGGVPFENPRDGAGIQDFVRDWLRNADYSFGPDDFDGSASRGFRIFNGRYKLGAYSFVAIQPEWAEHHK